MSAKIHGHEVMQMMIQSGQAYTRDSLRTAIVKTFGADARFHTCSAENMTAEELIAFFEARGKFLPSDGGGLRPDRDKICDHG